MFSYRSIVWYYLMKSCSCGLIPGISTSLFDLFFLLGAGSMPTGESPSEDWLQVCLLIKIKWLVQVNHNVFLNGVYYETEWGESQFPEAFFIRPSSSPSETYSWNLFSTLKAEPWSSSFSCHLSHIASSLFWNLLTVFQLVFTTNFSFPKGIMALEKKALFNWTDWC